jgi:hypothetical protein
VKAFFVTAISVLALLATTAVAHADDAAWRKQLQDLAAKLNTLQTEVSSLKAQNKDLQGQQQVQETEIKTKAPAPPPGTLSAASLNPADIVTKGEVPGSIKLPGTDTSIKFGGYIKLDVIDDIAGGSLGGTVSKLTVPPSPLGVFNFITKSRSHQLLPIPAFEIEVAMATLGHEQSSREEEQLIAKNDSRRIQVITFRDLHAHPVVGLSCCR